jgi:hypothetical protein
MGRMKDIFIDKMNNDRNGPDDSDWNAPTFDGAGFTEADKMADDYYQNEYGRNQPEPQPVSEQADGKKLWMVPSSKGDGEYKIWAFSYQQALQLLPMIESF